MVDVFVKFLMGNLFKYVMVMFLMVFIGLVVIFLVDFVDMIFILMLGWDELVVVVGYVGVILFFIMVFSIGMVILVGVLVVCVLGEGD